MKNFKKLLDSTLQQTELKRVRVKTDPANVKNGEIRKFNGYEGYFLAENEKGAKVYLENFEGGIIVTIPKNMIELDTNTNQNLQILKRAAIFYILKNKGKFKCDENLLAIIRNTSSIKDIEQYLYDAGFSKDDILNIYKLTINGQLQ